MITEILPKQKSELEIEVDFLRKEANVLKDKIEIYKQIEIKQKELSALLAKID